MIFVCLDNITQLV